MRFILTIILFFFISITIYSQKVTVHYYYILKNINDYDANYADENSIKFYINDENILYSQARKSCKQIGNLCAIPALPIFCICSGGEPGPLIGNDDCFKSQTDNFLIGPYTNFMDSPSIDWNNTRKVDIRLHAWENDGAYDCLDDDDSDDDDGGTFERMEPELSQTLDFTTFAPPGLPMNGNYSTDLKNRSPNWAWGIRVVYTWEPNQISGITFDNSYLCAGEKRDFTTNLTGFLKIMSNEDSKYNLQFRYDVYNADNGSFVTSSTISHIQSFTFTAPAIASVK